MTTVGFDQPLYILPFDHRGSFHTKMFGGTARLAPSRHVAQRQAVVILDGKTKKPGSSKKSSKKRGHKKGQSDDDASSATTVTI